MKCVEAEVEEEEEEAGKGPRGESAATEVKKGVQQTGKNQWSLNWEWWVESLLVGGWSLC
jgi:hypothetical protein